MAMLAVARRAAAVSSRAAWRAPALSMSTVPAKLTDEERKELLPALSKWEMVEGRDAITRTFIFDDFESAWSFMSNSATYAQAINHHPEWFNVYNKVEVTLSTHDCAGLSKNDTDFAAQMDVFAENLNAS